MLFYLFIVILERLTRRDLTPPITLVSNIISGASFSSAFRLSVVKPNQNEPENGKGAKTWLKNPQLVLVLRTLHGFLDQSQTEVKQN